MEISRRDFVLGGIGALLLGRQVRAGENLVLPSLEEITNTLPQDPDQILKPSLGEGDLKKLDYTRNTHSSEFYKVLNEFKNEIVFVYLNCNGHTVSRVKQIKGGEQADSGAALSFLYIIRNLRRKANVGFLFVEVKDFYGEENWRDLRGIFNSKALEFPSFVEFKRDSSGNYRFNGIAGCGLIKPESIWKSIEVNVGHYSKR